MSTELFPSNGCCTVACLHTCYLAMGLQYAAKSNQHVLKMDSHTVDFTVGFIHNSTQCVCCVILITFVNA
jgi:hypothetical protein